MPHKARSREKIQHIVIADDLFEEFSADKYRWADSRPLPTHRRADFRRRSSPAAHPPGIGHLVPQRLSRNSQGLHGPFNQPARLFERSVNQLPCIGRDAVRQAAAAIAGDDPQVPAERPDADACAIHAGPAGRTIGTATESYFIEISPEILSANDIPVPEAPRDSSAALNTIRTAAKQAGIVEEQWANIAKTRVEKRRAVKGTFDSEFRPRLLEKIATTPEDLAKSDRLVIEGDADRSVDRLTEQSPQSGAARISTTKEAVDGVKRRTRFFLTPGQRLKLEEALGALGNPDPVLGQEALEAILRHGEPGDGRLFQIFAASSGTWTSLVTHPDGPTCLVSGGVGRQHIDQPQDRPIPQEDPCEISLHQSNTPAFPAWTELRDGTLRSVALFLQNLYLAGVFALFQQAVQAQFREVFRHEYDAIGESLVYPELRPRFAVTGTDDDESSVGEAQRTAIALAHLHVGLRSECSKVGGMPGKVARMEKAIARDQTEAPGLIGGKDRKIVQIVLRGVLCRCGKRAFAAEVFDVESAIGRNQPRDLGKNLLRRGGTQVAVQG